MSSERSSDESLDEVDDAVGVDTGEAGAKLEGVDEAPGDRDGPGLGVGERGGLGVGERGGLADGPGAGERERADERKMAPLNDEPAPGESVSESEPSPSWEDILMMPTTQFLFLITIEMSRSGSWSQ